MAQFNSFFAEIETLSNALSLVTAFRAFDSDNDGYITAAELGGILSSLGYKTSEQDVNAMMQQADSNKDGLLSLDEFMEMNTKDMQLGNLGNSLRTAMESLNCDGDEIAITGEDLHEVMENLGIGYTLKDCQEIIASMDGDGDGAVSFVDIQLIINSL